IRDYKVTGVQTCALPISSSENDIHIRVRCSHFGQDKVLSGKISGGSEGHASILTRFEEYGGNSCWVSGSNLISCPCNVHAVTNRGDIDACFLMERIVAEVQRTTKRGSAAGAGSEKYILP